MTDTSPAATGGHDPQREAAIRDHLQRYPDITRGSAVAYLLAEVDRLRDGLPAFTCPACGAETRARLTDTAQLEEIERLRAALAAVAAAGAAATGEDQTS